MSGKTQRPVGAHVIPDAEETLRVENTLSEYTEHYSLYIDISISIYNTTNREALVEKQQLVLIWK